MQEAKLDISVFQHKKMLIITNLTIVYFIDDGRFYNKKSINNF